MKKKILVLSSLFVLTACNAKIDNRDSDSKTRPLPELYILEGDHFTVEEKSDHKVDNDGSISYLITFDEGYVFNKCDYENVDTERIEPWKFELTFNEVKYDSVVVIEARKLDIYNIKINPGVATTYTYSTVFSNTLDNQVYEGDTITLNCEAVKYYTFSGYTLDNDIDNGGEFLSNDYQCSFVPNGDINVYLNYDPIYKNSIIYHANGTLFSNGEEENAISVKAMEEANGEPNTLTNSNLKKEGYILTGWNTMSDGSGNHIGLGSKVIVPENNYIELYAEWKKAEEMSSFIFENGVIKSYLGEEKDIIVVPDEIDGIKVNRIESYAFANLNANTVYLPSGILAIADYAFFNSQLTDLYLYDDVEYISDKSFIGCTNFKSAHFNATLTSTNGGINRAKGNVYSHIKHSTKQKIVILGGSSAQYGYNSPMIKEMFDNKYEVYNLGHYAGFSGISQIQAILPYMNSGDIFIHAPEFSSIPIGADSGGISPINNQIESSFGTGIYFTSILETDWDIFANINIQSYSDVFDRFRLFNQERISTINAGIGYSYATPGSGLNYFGDIGTDYPLRDSDSDFGYNDFRFEKVEASSYHFDVLKIELAKLQAKGVKTYFTFAPINRSYLNGIYNPKDVDYICYLYFKHCESMIGNCATILLQQQETIYLGRYFYNSDVHLCREGSNIHTNKVINALQEDLKGAGYVF